MRSCSFTLIVALIGGTLGGCAMTDGDTEDRQTAAIAVPAVSQFVLSVATQDLPLAITASSGIHNSCAGSCTFTYTAGTSLTIFAGPRDVPECRQFGGWDGPCAGQLDPCTVVINSNISVTAFYGSIPHCITQ
jgi:hypothetical protein